MPQISPIAWWLFNLFILAMLVLDLLVFHRRPHEIKIKEALGWSAFWIALSLIFNLGIYFLYGNQAALEFLAGYVIEKSLSVDNIFVFLLIFSYFRVAGKYQHKVLFWGILGALVLRAIFIFAGIALINQFHWLTYLFGAFLVISGLKFAFEKEKQIQPERNPILRLFRRLIPVAVDYQGPRFFLREGGKIFATPLLVVLIVVETTDLIFAVDSIPAILAITRDPFIVYSSNAFAILGLRALYFAVHGMMEIFYFLHWGLAAILVFVGVKMLLADIFDIPIGPALGIVAGILLLSVAASLVFKAKQA